MLLIKTTTVTQRGMTWGRGIIMMMRASTPKFQLEVSSSSPGCLPSLSGTGSDLQPEVQVVPFDGAHYLKTAAKAASCFY
jgi:hypothetical protein